MGSEKAEVKWVNQNTFIYEILENPDPTVVGGRLWFTRAGF
jgi:hypothetical protein